MSSTFAGLNTMVRGLYAQQTSLDTVGHNVSNASTAGYSRQSVNLATTTPETIYTGNGSVQKGTGVAVTSIVRARDLLVDKQMWTENSTLNYGQVTQASLAKIEGAFGEPSATGVQSVLNNFWESLQTLATNASDVGVRTAVRERGVALANTIQHSAQQLKDMVADLNSTIEIKVSSINQSASEIASLNKQIRNIEVGGMDHANDLRDKRDLLVDQLSSLVDVRVTEGSDGTFTVQTGSVILVNGDDYKKLTTDLPAGTVITDPDYGYELKEVSIAGTYQPVTFTNGEVQGMIEMRDSDQTGVKKYLNDLSTMSQFLLQDFNQVSRSGYGTDNSTNNNFFGAGDNTNPDYMDALVSGNFTKGDWIQKLQVNPDLFNATNGIAKIAAKAASNSIGVTQSSAAGGSAAVFATGTYSGGETPTSVVIKAATVVGNTINNIRYSTDGGVTYNSADIPVNANGSYSLTISGLTVTMYIKDDATSTNAVNDTYSYTLDKNTANSSISVTQSNALGGVGAITSATGTYTQGDIATAVVVKPVSIDATTTATTIAGRITQIKYSTDGGTNWSTTAISLNTDGTFSIPISGITVKMQLATDTDNTTNDQYKFTLSKGNVASGDNAVLLSKRLKVDTKAALGNASLDGYYSSMISALGVKSQNSIRLTDNQQTLVDQITNWRESVSGVNMDEEMANMIKYQKGYSAAARMLTTMDEMLDKLINGTGMVGR